MQGEINPINNDSSQYMERRIWNTEFAHTHFNMQSFYVLSQCPPFKVYESIFKHCDITFSPSNFDLWNCRIWAKDKDCACCILTPTSPTEEIKPDLKSWDSGHFKQLVNVNMPPETNIWLRNKIQLYVFIHIFHLLYEEVSALGITSACLWVVDMKCCDL